MVWCFFLPPSERIPEAHENSQLQITNMINGNERQVAFELCRCLPWIDGFGALIFFCICPQLFLFFFQKKQKMGKTVTIPQIL